MNETIGDEDGWKIRIYDYKFEVGKRSKEDGWFGWL